MKAVMYHYVREKRKDIPFFVYLDVNDFEKQILYFKKKYTILNKNEFEHCLKTNEIKLNSIVLTFDDGLSDHYKYVYPILKKYNIWGIFYISVLPYTENVLLDVHRIHYLLGKYGGQKILFSLMNLISEDDLIPNSSDKFRTKTYMNQNNEESVTKVKQFVNYYIKPQRRTHILRELMRKMDEDETKIVENYYLTREQITEMIAGGMSIGSHSQTHTLLSNLTREEQKKEVDTAKKVLNSICNSKDFNSFCYPYGGKHSYDDDTLFILEKEGYDSAFSVESRDIGIADLKQRYELPRYDCNEFKFGKASMRKDTNE